MRSASANGLQPWFEVNPTQGFQGFFWSPGGTVDLSWDTPSAPPVEVSVDGAGQWSWSPEDWSAYPRAGSHVTATDGIVTKTLDVSSLWVTLADPLTDVLSGIAGGGDQVQVGVYGYGSLPAALTADVNGRWSVDLGALDPPVDLVTWQGGGSAEVRDADGDATTFGWAVPTPFLRASVFDGGSVYSHNWQQYTDITLSVDKPGTANDARTVVTADYVGTVAWELPWEYGIAPGDVVTATSEDGLITRTVVVPDFGIDIVTLPDTVIGHAPAGAEVHVYVGSTDGIVTADAQGVWTYVTTEDLLQEGNNINASLMEPDGDFVEDSFYIRSQIELGQPGPSDGRTWASLGESVTYWTDMWVAYRAAPETFTVTWDWGDGTTSSGTVVYDQGDPDVASVIGTHNYRRVGLYPVSVTVSQPGIPTATSGQSDFSFASIYDTKRPATVSGSATVVADAGSGGYYDLDFGGGNVNLAISAARTAKSGALSGTVTVTVPAMRAGEGMTFTGSSLEYLYANNANRLGNEIMLYVHGMVTNLPGGEPTAAGAMIHLIDRAKGADLLRITLQDEGGMGYPILDTAATAAAGQEPPWTTSYQWVLSSTDDQTTASTLKVR